MKRKNNITGIVLGIMIILVVASLFITFSLK